MKRDLQSEKGFTLIELLVATALLAVIITVVTSLSVQGSFLERDTYNQYVLHETGQQLLHRIENGFQEQGIKTPGLYSASDVATAEGILVYRVGNYQVAYYQDGDSLYRRVEEQPGVLDTTKDRGEAITSGVKSFVVQGRELVVVELVLYADNNQNTEIRMSTKIRPRNIK